MKTGNKQTNLDMAFEDALLGVGRRFGIQKRRINILARLTGKKRVLKLTVNDSDKLAGQISIGELLSKKLIALRVGIMELYIMLRALQDCFMEGSGASSPEQVDMILYHSDKCDKPCVGVRVKGAPYKTLILSQVLEIIDDGSILDN